LGAVSRRQSCRHGGERGFASCFSRSEVNSLVCVCNISASLSRSDRASVSHSRRRAISRRSDETLSSVSACSCAMFPATVPVGPGANTRASSEGSMRNCPFSSFPAESLPCLIALKIVERCKDRGALFPCPFGCLSEAHIRHVSTRSPRDTEETSTLGYQAFTSEFCG
jgi:hypothetical protein